VALIPATILDREGDAFAVNFPRNISVFDDIETIHFQYTGGAMTQTAMAVSWVHQLWCGLHPVAHWILS
jgi:hypothetical protein